MGVTGGPNIVLDSAVFCVDAANPKSYSDSNNVLFDSNGNISWTVGNLGTTVSRATVIPNERYKIITTDNYAVTYSNMRFYIGPIAKLINGQYYNLSYKWKLNYGGRIKPSDWNDTALINVVDVDYGSYRFYSAAGMRAVYDGPYNFMDFDVSAYSEVEIWDVKLEKGTTYTPYTNNSLFKWTDLAGNASAPLNTAIRYSSGSIVFNPSSYEIRAPFSALGSNHPLTIECWINTTHSSYAAGYAGIMTLGYNPNMCILNDGRAQWWWGDYVTYPRIESDTSLNDGKWHNVCGTYDGSTARLYIDGKPEGTPQVKQMATIYNDIVLGNEYNNGWKLFIGSIALARVHTRALSSVEVLQNYNALKSRFKLP